MHSCMDNAFHHTALETFIQLAADQAFFIRCTLNSDTHTHTHTHMYMHGLSLTAGRLQAVALSGSFTLLTVLSCIQKTSDFGVERNQLLQLPIRRFNKIWQAKSPSCCFVYTDYTTEHESLAEFSLERGGQRRQLNFDGKGVQCGLGDSSQQTDAGDVLMNSM